MIVLHFYIKFVNPAFFKKKLAEPQLSSAKIKPFLYLLIKETFNPNFFINSSFKDNKSFISPRFNSISTSNIGAFFSPPFTNP